MEARKRIGEDEFRVCTHVERNKLRGGEGAEKKKKKKKKVKKVTTKNARNRVRTATLGNYPPGRRNDLTPWGITSRSGSILTAAPLCNAFWLLKSGTDFWGDIVGPHVSLGWDERFVVLPRLPICR